MKDPEIAYVYAHTRLDTGEIFYIGIGVSSNYGRAYDKTNRNKFWNHIVSKTDYDVKVLFDYLSWEKARLKEIRLIKLIGRRDLKTGSLVNLTDGGDGSYKRIVTEETREKIRVYQSGKKKSKESIAKRLSKTNGITPENRLKMTAARKLKGWTSQKEKSVICNSTGIIYLSIKDAALHFGFHKSYLARMLRGERKNISTLAYFAAKA